MAVGFRVAEADTHATRHRATRTPEVARRRANATRVNEVRIHGRAVVRRDRPKRCHIQVRTTPFDFILRFIVVLKYNDI